MTLLFFAPIALAVISNVLYHLFQKATPAQANPLIALAVTYGSALAACLLLLVLFPPAAGVGDTLAQINWASVTLGVAILGLEMGYLLAYRMGWPVSLAGLISNVTVGLILLPIGLWLFRERLSWVNLAGIIFCIAGIILVNLKIGE
jgi:drug/metabolite transporter (DMT)-like permease